VRSPYQAVDLFCGAGGTTTGAEQSGAVKVKLAVNHWRTAVYSHQQNHPDVRHICAEVDSINPLEFQGMNLKVLLASPECVGHSNARGSRPVNDQRRASAWCVPRWAEALRPDWIVCENVREFEDWAPLGVDGKPLKSRKGEIFAAWVQAIRACNYHVEWKSLNAADYGGATSRVRMFVVARRGRSSQPIPWPTPTHSRENWTPAYTIIDWSKPAYSIFDRTPALVPKTLARIERGLHKFCSPDNPRPFIVKYRGTGTVSDVNEPMPTITAGGHHLAVAMPFVVKYHGGTSDKRNGTDRQYSLLDPLPTIDTQPRFGMAIPFVFDMIGRGAGRSKSVEAPLPTIVAARKTHGLVLPFITEYYGTGGARGVDEPLSTVTTKHRHGLTLVELKRTMERYRITDILYRMFGVDELAAAQGFPPGYFLHGAEGEKIKQVGNSVHTAVAKALCTAIGQAA
jgi:DNA (cytosine-5)-methyltransferase 1